MLFSGETAEFPMLSSKRFEAFASTSGFSASPFTGVAISGTTKDTH